MTLIGLSHPIRHGMTTYPGLPTPEIGAHLTHDDSRAHYGPGTEFNIGLSALLAAGIPIIEHLRGLDQLPERGFRFHAVPPPIEGMSSFPVRAYAVLDT